MHRFNQCSFFLSLNSINQRASTELKQLRPTQEEAKCLILLLHILVTLLLGGYFGLLGGYLCLFVNEAFHFFSSIFSKCCVALSHCPNSLVDNLWHLMWQFDSTPCHSATYDFDCIIYEFICPKYDWSYPKFELICPKFN